MTAPFRLRTALVSDLPALCRLERLGFANPWPEAIYRDELDRAYADVEVAVDSSDRVVGVSCSWIAVGEGHLLRLVTAPQCRRLGVARDLLSAVVARAQNAGCAHILLEVAKHNQAAVALYLSAGFLVVGLREAYYRSPPDDALVMRLPLHHRAAALGGDAVDS